VSDVVILTLSDPAGCGDACGGAASTDSVRCDGAETPRVPVLACADALRARGATVDLVTACEEAEIDAAVKPVEAGDSRLIVAAASDAELRAVVRRLVRRYAPPPSNRPADLPPDRTVFDLPPLGILPLTPGLPELVIGLGLPQDPATVAAATLAGRERRLDLLRHDGGSVVLGGCLVGGAGELTGWRGRVEVDDVILTDGNEPIIACSVRNVGSSDVDGLPLVRDADPADGRIEVAVAVPVMRRRWLREASVRLEVRRARGRGVSILPHAPRVGYVEDGVSGALTRKRSWWIEPGAWATYVM
jgi:hypothetical protein